MISRNLFLVLLIIIIAACSQRSDDINEIEKPTDSIADLLKSPISDIATKEANLLAAYKLNEFETNDSIKNRNFLKISYQALKIGNSLLFKKANKKSYPLSIKLNDTFGLADYHWNNGAYYGKQEVLDSAYYHYYQAQKYYELINHTNYSAKMLYNMAFIQSRTKDYINSEAKLFEAISKYKDIDKYLSLYKCYNLLGSVYSDLGQYENSLLYHDKSLEFLAKEKNKRTYEERSLNDIGLTYSLQNQYDNSIEVLNQALKKDSLFYKDSNLYAKLLDNLAYSKLLKGDTLSIYNDFNKSLKIRDSLNDYSGIVISKIHLAEYFAVVKDTSKAIVKATEANILATKINNNRDILSSLILLSKIDKNNSGFHLNEYVTLNNKIEKQERLLKNKFARIRFETDEYIDKSEKLSLQKTILIISVIALFSIFSLLYFLRSQRAKTKELLLKNEQQEANEEIYRLMLKQQSKLEEGRLKERHRISEELHDGVLGKIFGARMGLGFLEIEGDNEELDKHQQYINDLQKIEKEIRDISHELKNEILSSKADYISIIRDLIEEKSKIGKFDYSISNEESTYWNDCSDAIKINCYRIIQESIQNIIKHSRAKNIALVFNYKKENLKFTIADDGVGFNTNKTRKGIGLSNIQSRVKALNGNIAIKSVVNKGTVIKVEIPNIRWRT